MKIWNMDMKYDTRPQSFGKIYGSHNGIYVQDFKQT
jgi:hypothetical protein